jgi:hypothetical protein
MQSPEAVSKAGKDQPERHLSGPRPLGAVVATVIRPVFSKRPASTAQLTADWALIVGPSMAGETTPRRFSAGTLTVACNGPVALELQHLSESLLARINQHMGHRMVQQLRFVQDIQQRARPVPIAKHATVDSTQATEAALAGIPVGPLRDALASLGLAVLRGRGP